jgi:hypothetical protein
MKPDGDECKSFFFVYFLLFILILSLNFLIIKALCGNGACELSEGENCVNCPADTRPCGMYHPKVKTIKG